MNDKPILQKAFRFATRIANMYKYLCDKKKEHTVSKQILRSGTSVGANISEGYCASSKKDFIAKFHIAFKECEETLYWLKLLKETKAITELQYKSMHNDCHELVKLISSTIKTSKNNLAKPSC